MQLPDPWHAITDVVEVVLRFACEEPFSQAAAVCTSWRDTFARVQLERWRALKSILLARRAAAEEEQASILVDERGPSMRMRLIVQELEDRLANEIARLVQSFGTAVANSTTGPYQRRVLAPPDAPPPFDFGAAIDLLRRNVGTASIEAQCVYVEGGAAGVEWFDPEDAPLNTAALFVGVAASLETLGRSGASTSELDERTERAIELFRLLATVPGNALERDVFSVCVPFYHEYEECFGNITAMCRSLFRTGCLYDAGSRLTSELHVNTFPLPGGWMRLGLSAPHALRFAWAVFETQTLIESLHPGSFRPGSHFGNRGREWPILPSSALSTAALDLFLAPSARTLVACPEIDQKRESVWGTARSEACHRHTAARQLLTPAVRLLKECGTLCIDTARVALTLWAASLRPEPEVRIGGGALALLAVGALQLPRALTSLMRGVVAEADKESAQVAAQALVPPLAPHVWESLMVDGTKQGDGAETRQQWDDLMSAPAPLRRALLRAMPSVPFELTRRRDTRRLRALLSMEPSLAGSLRCQPNMPPQMAWNASVDAAADSRVSRAASWDLLVAACAGRGLTHQLVSCMLQSHAFVACGDGGVRAVLTARLACVAAARDVHNNKTGAVLRGAWGVLAEARVNVVAEDGTVRVTFRLS